MGMTQEIKDKEPDARVVYADIIDLPHWQSPTRPHMSLYERSAQFASYKALSGYEDMIAEEARLTDEMPALEEYGLERLNRKLNQIAAMLADGLHPSVRFTVFVPDDKKSGGAYVEITDTVKRIDTALGKVVLMSTEGRGQRNKTIDFEQIITIAVDPESF